jgi:hypothetical protein
MARTGSETVPSPSIAVAAVAKRTSLADVLKWALSGSGECRAGRTPGGRSPSAASVVRPGGRAHRRYGGHVCYVGTGTDISSTNAVLLARTARVKALMRPHMAIPCYWTGRSFLKRCDNLSSITLKV